MATGQDGFSIHKGFLIDRKCMFYILLTIERVKGRKYRKMNRKQKLPNDTNDYA